jgi:sulfite reductase (NADPH) hemoprotein beta-component
MGMSHGNVHTFPRLADVIGFITREQLIEAARAVVTVHRDFGDRTNRKHARLKYVLEEKGPVWFREEVERRTGWKFQNARPFKFTKQGDVFGWRQQFDGNHFLGLYVEAGRIKDTETVRLKTALREIVEKFHTEIRLTPSQNLLLANVKLADRDAITALLAAHGVPVDNQATIIRRASMACPAMPTCGLALAESERALPGLLASIEGLLAEVGLKDEEIIIRMTGCPNGCARSSMAELGFIGKGPGKYQICVGGNESSTRLNRPHWDSVKGEDIVTELRPVFARFARERTAGERFGDFSARVLWKENAAAPG